MERADLRPGEDEALAERKKLLRSAGKIMGAVDSACYALFGSDETQGALDLVEAQKAETPAFRQLQPLPENYCCAVYVEFNLDDKGGLCPVLEKLAPVIAQSGGDADNTWVARHHGIVLRENRYRHESD